MKKLLSIILILTMLLSLTACGGSSSAATTTAPETTVQETEAPTTEEPTTEEPTTEEPTTEEPTTEEPTTEEPTTEAPAANVDESKIGHIVDGVYTNAFIGITCTLDDYWTIATREEMAQIQGLTADMMSDEDLAEMLKNSGSVYDLYAFGDEGLVTLNIIMENQGLLYSVILSEQDYVDLSLPQVGHALESMGLTDVECSAVTVSFAGKDHAGIQIHALYEGFDFYETVVCVKVGNYLSVITAGSYFEDVTGDVLALFSDYESEE